MESSCYLVSRLLVTLVALCLVPWCSAQTCVATGENSACTESRSCKKENPVGVCMAASDVSTPSPPGNSCMPHHSFEPGQCSTLSGDPPDVPPVVRVYSINWEHFALNVSWHSNGSTGAKIVISQITPGLIFPTILDCLCLPPNSLGHSYSKFFPYSHRGGDTLSVEVYWSNDLSFSVDQRRIALERNYPRSCLDIEHEPSTCGLPVYEAPTNISICKRVSTDQNSTISISWDYETDYPYPSAFYVSLFDPPDYTFSKSFTAVNSTSVEITIPVGLVDMPFSVRIRPFYECSGLANGKKDNHNIGCGKHYYRRDVLVMGLPNCPTAPTITVTLLPSTTDSLSDSTDQMASTASTAALATGVTAPSQNLIIGISVACGTSVTILLALSIAMFVTVYRCRRRPKPDWTSPNQPTFDREHSVFVAYMPHDAAEEAIQTCVVAPLLHQCHFMVVTAGRKVRGNMVEWVEEQGRKASSVLFVVTEDFQCAWDSTLTKSQFIEAVRRLITSSVAQGRLEDKYAIVVLDESSKRFIPASNYLRNLNTYVLGDQVQDVYNFVTKSKMFQHRNHRESSDSSLASSVGSSGVKSVCTVSVDLDSDSLGSHEDVPTSVSHSDPGLEELHAILTPTCDSVSNCDSV